MVSLLTTEEILTSIQLPLGGVIVAFDALDNVSKLLAIIVEATDLLSIPPVLDPVTKKPSENTSSIDCLTSVVSQLSEKLSL